jgi:hypothetical protein
VFPLRLAPGASLPLLDDVQWVDLIDDEFGSGVGKLIAGQRAAGLDPAGAAISSNGWAPRSVRSAWVWPVDRAAAAVSTAAAVPPPPPPVTPTPPSLDPAR